MIWLTSEIHIMASWFPFKGHPRWCQILPKLAGWEELVWKIILYRCLIILNHRTKKIWRSYSHEIHWFQREDLFWEFNISSVKELHRFYSRFILCKIQQFIPRMNQINSAHSFPYCFLKIYFNPYPTNVKNRVSS